MLRSCRWEQAAQSTVIKQKKELHFLFWYRSFCKVSLLLYTQTWKACNPYYSPSSFSVSLIQICLPLVIYQFITIQTFVQHTNIFIVVKLRVGPDKEWDLGRKFIGRTNSNEYHTRFLLFPLAQLTVTHANEIPPPPILLLRPRAMDCGVILTFSTMSHI